MRLFNMILMLGLCLVTDLVYRPLLQAGVGSLDVPLLFVLWLAQTDRRTRVYVVVAILGLLRCAEGVDGFWSALLPLCAGVESQYFWRRWVHMRDPYLRLLVLAFSLGVATACKGLVLGLPAIADLWLESLGWGLLIGELSAALLFPILDATSPLLRSYRYPM